MTVSPSHVEIRYIRGTNQFSRPVLYGQLYSLLEEKTIFDGSLVQILQLINTKNLVLMNAKSVLETVVITHGFGS